MRALGCFLILALLGVVAIRAQTADRPIIPSDRLQVRAAIDPASAKAGTPITAKLVSKNIWYDTLTVSAYDRPVVSRAAFRTTRESLCRRCRSASPQKPARNRDRQTGA